MNSKTKLRLRDSCSPPIPHLHLWANTLPVAMSTLRGAELWAICLTDTTLPFTYHTLQDLGALSIWVWQGRNQEKLTFLICFSIYLRLLPWWLRWLKKQKNKNCLQWRRLEFHPLVRIRHNWATNTYLRLESKFWAYPMENNMEVSLKTKNRVTIWPSSFTPGHISGKDKKSNLKRYMHLSVHSRTIYTWN